MRVIGYFAGAVLAAGSAALLFRHLGVVDTGRYVTAVSLVAIVGGLADLGLTSIGVRELSVRDYHSARRMASNLLGMRIAGTLLGLGVAVAFAAVAGYGALLVAGVALAGTGLLLQSVQQTLAISLMSALRLGWVTVADLLRQTITVVLIVVGVLVGVGLLPFLAATIPAGAVTLLLTARLVRGSIPLRPSFQRQEWRLLLARVLPYSAAVAAATLYFRIAIILVSLLASARQLGYFSASFRIIEVLMVVPGLILSSAFPIFARAANDDHQRLAYAVRRVFDLSLIIGAWVALLLGLGAPLAIEIIGGSDFGPAVPVLAVLGVALGATFVGGVWANTLLSLGHHRDILLINLGALVGGSVLVAALVAADAARGAAIATSAVEVVLPVVAGLVLLRRNPEVMPPMRIVPRVALAALLGASAAFLPVPSAVRAVIGSALFLATLFVLRAVPWELFDELGLRSRLGRGSLPGGPRSQC